MRGPLSGEMIEDANIVNYELPLFGYHAGLNLPSVATVKGSRSMSEVDEGIYRLQVHVNQI